MTTTLSSFTAPDGTPLAIHECGEGRPVVLLHGLFSNAMTNWIRFGQAERIAAKGFRVIMPDLRGHGKSGAPHEAAAYPPDILVDDGIALLAHLGLEPGQFDLGGYSLGARTVARMLIRGVKPRRAILAGMGLTGMMHTGRRRDFFRYVLLERGRHERSSPEWMAEAFLKATGGDPLAMLPLLDSFVDSSEAELRGIDVETLVLCGDADDDNGSAEALAALLPHGRFETVPGDHMSVVAKPPLGEAMAEFLGA